MHLEIKFYKNKPIVLPIQYNHIVQAAIYNIIDSNLADFLHNEGFGEARKFKMFTFSRLIGKFDVKSKPGYIIFDKEVSLAVSSPYGAFCQSFANGIIKKEINLGDNRLEVVEASLSHIEVKTDEMIIETLSPIVAYSTLTKADGTKYTLYFQPGEKDFESLINQNLLHKYEAFYGSSIEGMVSIKPISKIKQNIVEYKGFVIKGYSGLFKVKGHKELLKIGLEAGFGSKNSMGFGYVRRKTKN